MSEKESKAPVTMDIYMRMNDDSEQDYCFNVPGDKPVKWLHQVIDTLPMVLSPSYFYNPKPIGFAVSKEPGFLTSEGGLLFNRMAHFEEHLKKVDQDAKIEDVCWEGQLFIPLWEYNYTRQITVLSLLGIWLYMDFPSSLNPTPGYAPTVLIYELACKIAPVLRDESESAFAGPIWEWVFFAIHVVKVLFIYMLLWVGGVNPVSFNPLTNRRALQKEMSREKLLEIGWTSSRRATPSEWVEENRKGKIEKHGGVVAAYHAGVLENIGSAGVELGKGEGWDSDPKQADQTDELFRVNERYFRLVYKQLAEQIQDPEKDDEQKGQLIKQFRRIGPEEGPEELTEQYKKRKELENKQKKAQS